MFRRIVHPGAIRADELEELGVSKAEFARQIDVPANRITQIIKGSRSITGDTALRFGHWFGTDPQFQLVALYYYTCHRGPTLRRMMASAR